MDREIPQWPHLHHNLHHILCPCLHSCPNYSRHCWTTLSVLNKVHVLLFTKWKLSLIGWNGCYHKQNNLLKQSKSNFQSWLSQLDICQDVTRCPQGNCHCEANNCPRVEMLVSAESSLAAPCDALPNSKVSKWTYSGFCQQQTHYVCSNES